MANPVIDSVTAVPSTVAPGGSSTITVLAHDPDSRDVTISLTVEDGQGNVTPGSVIVTIADPLTYGATVPAADGAVVQDGGEPHIFHFTAAS
jgi:hypothetical protein